MIKLLKKLVQADTTSKNGEIAAAKAIDEFLEGSPLETTLDCWGQGRANIVAKLNSIRKNKALLFACHLDVVPQGQAEWEKPAFSGIEADGRIYGRGTADMKGGTAACIAAIRQIAESG
ncbi:MAG: M20/M25/M40 family metallo-hydrolase, partial [Candidatus Brocadiia bacterium]